MAKTFEEIIGIETLPREEDTAVPFEELVATEPFLPLPEPKNVRKQADDIIGIASGSNVSLNEARQIAGIKSNIEQMRKMGKIGFWEAAYQDIGEKLPFSTVGAFKMLGVWTAMRRLQQDEYEDYPNLREYDIRVVDDYIKMMEERRERGYTGWGKFGAAISEVQAWMMEFWLTGGLKKVGAIAAKKALQRHVKSRLAMGISQWLAGAAVRASVGMPHRTVEAVLRRRLTDDPENWATSISLGWGEVFIEALSEEAGGAITTGLSKVTTGVVTKMPFGKKFLGALQAAWMSLSPDNTAVKFANRAFTRAGYHGIVGEIGEERLATLLHGIVGTDDFGAGEEAGPLARIIAGFKQDWENKYIELGVFGTISGGQITLGKLGQFVESWQKPAEIAPEAPEKPVAARKPEIREEVPKEAKPTEIERSFDIYSRMMPDATEKEIVIALLEDGLEPPAELLEKYKDLPAIQELIEQKRNERIIAEAAAQKRIEKQKVEVKEIPPRPLVSPKASALQQDKQLRIQQAWDRKYGKFVPKPAEAVEKEPWQMTFEEYLEKMHKEWPGRTNQTSLRYHHDYVEEAVEQGKPVPREVLEEYKSEEWAQEALKKKTIKAKPEEAWKYTQEEWHALRQKEIPALRAAKFEPLTGWSLDAYRDIIKDALARGEKIRPEVLKQFKNESWAQEALAKIEEKPVEEIPKERPEFAKPVTPKQTQEAFNALKAELPKLKRLSEGERAEAIKALRKRQVARGGAIGERIVKRRGTARQAVLGAVKGFKDIAGTPEYAPPNLSDLQWETLYQKVYETYPQYKQQFQQARAGQALDKLSKGHILMNSEIGLLSKVVGPDIADQIQKTMRRVQSRADKFWSFVNDFIYFWKMPFNFDVQFLRNATDYFITNPVKFTQATWKALKAYKSQEYADNTIESVDSNPNNPEAREAGVVFLGAGKYARLEDLPEQYRSRLPVRMAQLGKERALPIWIPTMPIRGFGRWLLAAERAMAASMDWFKQSLWDAEAKNWQHAKELLASEEISKEDKAAIKDELVKRQKAFADVINTFTKTMRARTSTGKAIQKTANLVLWSPSMTFSRFKKPFLLLTSHGNRILAVEMLAASIAKIYLIGALGQFLINCFRDEEDEVEIELDPRSSNWGRIRDKDTWYDLGGGEIQHYRAMARLITGEIKTQSGRTVEVPRWSVISDFAETRETAIIGVFHELFFGSDVRGKKVWVLPTPEELEAEDTPLASACAEILRKAEGKSNEEKALLLSRFMFEHIAPAFVQSFCESSIADGWPQGAGSALVEFGALAAQSYKTGARAELQSIEDSMAQSRYGKDWQDITEKQQQTIKKQIPDFAKIETRIRKEDRQWEPRLRRYPSKKEEEVGLRMHEAMSSRIKQELDKYGIVVGAIKRTIGDGFYLNDERYKYYEERTIANLKTHLRDLFNSSKYRGEGDKRKRVELIQKEINEAKKVAREEFRKAMEDFRI